MTTCCATPLEFGPAPELALPVLAAPSLYEDAFAKIVEEICTPYDQASPGDIVAIYFDWKIYRGTTSSYPITHVLRITDDAPSYVPKKVAFLDLPEAQQAEIALGCMHLQCIGLERSAVDLLAEYLDGDVGEGFYFSFLLMPGLALLHADDPIESVFNGDYCGDPLSQDIVNDAFLLLLPKEATSNHQLVEIFPSIQSACNLVNGIFPIMDDSGEERVPLKLPDLTPVMRGHVARSL